MEKKVLITGGAGFIGSFLADQLLAAGYRVRLLDNLTSQVHPDGRPDYLNPEAELIEADIRDQEAVDRALDGIELVIHAAAAVGVGQSMYQVRHYVDVNVAGTANLLELLLERPKPIEKLLIFTSMTGYGEGLYRRPSDGRLLRVGIRSQAEVDRYGWDPVCPETGEMLQPIPTPEDSTLLARNIYALTKRYQEELALSLGRTYGFPVVCLRLFNVYGPRQSLNNPYTGVLAIFLNRLLNNQPPVIYEDGKQTRDFVSVHDVARAVLLALKQSRADDQIINIGTGISRSIADIACTLARLLNKPIEPHITGQFRQGDIRHCGADISRARDLLDFTSTVDWEESLSEIINWAHSVTTVDHFEQAQQELQLRGLIK